MIGAIHEAVSDAVSQSGELLDIVKIGVKTLAMIADMLSNISDELNAANSLRESEMQHANPKAYKTYCNEQAERDRTFRK